MKMISGLFDNMVLQRDRRNRSNANFEGECAQEGVLRLRVKSGGAVLRRFSRANAGESAGGKFSGIIRGLPAGGPYEILVSVEDKRGLALDQTVVRNVLVGDVWVLGGQSNMEGLGHLKYAAKPQSKVRAYYMDDRWDVAKDPIHNITHAVDPAHFNDDGKLPARAPHTGVGPGVAFGMAMLSSTGVPQGLIACAHGGSAMAQWDASGVTNGRRNYYAAMLDRFRKNGGKVSGVIWHQGCSDAVEQHYLKYTERMIELVKSMRVDFGNARLPVVVAQIGRVYSNDVVRSGFWNSIQEQQRCLPEHIRFLAVVPTIDLGMDDRIHISGFDQHRLGKRMAQAMHVLIGHKKAGLPPLALDSIVCGKDKDTGLFLVRVKFRNVTGSLQAPGRPAGFYLLEKGRVNPFVFRIDLAGDTAIIRCFISNKPQTLTLYYGYGLQPYCNITDSADRSLPVFGPLPLKDMSC